jgi:putative tryptophan/tyrosine transport system substrate-binding protein
VKRREFITLLGSSIAAWPLASRAQQSDPMRRISVLTGLAESDLETSQYVTTFRNGLQDLGWRDGQNVHIDYRWAAGDTERIRSYAAEIVRLAPDVIFVSSPSVLSEMIQATRTIPIVFVQVADPVAGGYVASLANPGW